MKIMRLGWFFPVLSIVLCTFIIVAAQTRRGVIRLEAQQDLETTVEFAVNTLYERIEQSSAVDALVEGHIDAATMHTLHQKIGLSPLLTDPNKLNLVYIALQSEEGILASSPQTPALSSWSDDPLLATARKQPRRQILFRRTDDRRRSLLEGIVAFPVPTGTSGALIGSGKSGLVARAEAPPVLRVAVDTDMADDERWMPRIWMVSTLSSLLILASVVVTVFLRRGEKGRLAAERAVLTQEAEARHWQAIGEMAATVAHEVRNPLNTIGMAAQRLEREFDIPEEDQADYDDLTGVLKGEADRVGEIVTEFLELGRPLHLQMDAHLCEEVVLEALIPMRLRAEKEEKRLVVECEYEGERHVDRHRLIQIIGNLVGNGLDAIGPDGAVTVRLDSRENNVRLLVEDDGEGMDDETLKRALQPFVTTKARGTGLGLPLTQRLVEAHGGRLSLSSSPGEGTRVEVLFPDHR